MKITKTQLSKIIQEEVAKSIEEGMMDKIGTKFRSMTGRSTPQDKYKHYIAKANKMILDLATFMFREMDLDGAPDTTEELLKNSHGHDVRLSAIKKALKRSKLMRNDTIKKAVESLDNLIHDKNTDVALQYFAGGDDLEKFRGHPFMAAVRWIDSYDVDDVASALSRTWSNKRSGDDDRKAAIRQRNIDSERETTHRDREQLNQRVAAKKYQKQVAAERERELSRQGNRDNLSADTTMGAFGESLDRTKISKSKLEQIVQEELASIVEEGMMDAIRSRLSPKRPAKAPAPRERNKHEKKQWRQQGGADAYDFNLGMLERPNFPNDKDYMEGWNDSLQEGKNKIKITKSALAQIVQEELTAMKAEGYGNYKRDDNDWGDLEENEIYALEALMSLGDGQRVDEIAEKASEEYENAIRSIDYSDPRNPDTGLGEEDFDEYIQTALDSLKDKGKVRLVRLTQGEEDPDERPRYALA